MNRIFQWIFASLLTLSTWAAALELTDLQLPLTRTEADQKLDKNYRYAILQDGSIRRAWKQEKKTIAVDFSARNDKAICVTITYDTPISRKVALEDCRQLCGNKAEGIKWAATKKEAMANLGMKDAHALKLNDSTYLFREDVGKDKTARVSLFAHLPKTNRWALSEIDGERRTAMGNSSASGNIKALIADEARRQATPANRGETIAAATAPKPSMVTTHSRTQVRQPVSTPSAAVTKEDRAANIPVSTPTEPKQANNLLEALGLDQPTPVHYCIGGGIALLILIVLCGIISSARRKAKARANFNTVSASRPASAQPVQRVAKDNSRKGA